MDSALIPGPAARTVWLGHLERLALPVLAHAATGDLGRVMTVEHRPGWNPDGRPSALEAVARTLAGIAPWLAAEGGDDGERALRGRCRTLALAALERIPADHPLDAGMACLVELGFIGHALVRWPGAAAALPAIARGRLAASMQASHRFLPVHNNWSCFTAMGEAGIEVLGGEADRLRVDHCLRLHESWYLGDGQYGDGPELHCDYYNSFVIQPMLVDLLDRFAARWWDWQAMHEPVRRRAVRHAAVLERMIAPDGSFPVIGRSLAYRCGAFQHLAQAALQGWLPAEVPPGQARAALTAVIRRTLDAPGTLRPDGFLSLGLCGHQPGVAESYLSTGSAYLCLTAFLPLGLPPEHPFWAEPAQPWTGLRAWTGQDIATDHALTGLVQAPGWTRGVK